MRLESGDRSPRIERRIEFGERLPSGRRYRLYHTVVARSKETAEAIRDGWLLHFPAGTTKQGAPLRAGVSRLLHDTRAIALPVRVDGFRELLLHKQVPGKLFRRCSVKIHPPLELDEFYSKPYRKEQGAALLERLEGLIGDPAQ